MAELVFFSLFFSPLTAFPLAWRLRSSRFYGETTSQ
jgi:hypothetical protein